jgi:hypothetical protein
MQFHIQGQNTNGKVDPAIIHSNVSHSFHSNETKNLAMLSASISSVLDAFYRTV